MWKMTKFDQMLLYKVTEQLLKMTKVMLLVKTMSMGWI